MSVPMLASPTWLAAENQKMPSFAPGQSLKRAPRLRLAQAATTANLQPVKQIEVTKRASAAQLEADPARLANAGAVPVIDSAVMQIWEGTVEDVDWSTRKMQVQLVAKIGAIPTHTGEIDLQWVNEQDLDLVKLGAVFYLTLYKQTKRGTVRNSQELRFRRRPSWSKAEISAVRSEVQRLLTEIRLHQP